MDLLEPMMGRKDSTERRLNKVAAACWEAVGGVGGRRAVERASRRPGVDIRASGEEIERLRREAVAFSMESGEMETETVLERRCTRWGVTPASASKGRISASCLDMRRISGRTSSWPTD